MIVLLKVLCTAQWGMYGTLISVSYIVLQF
jgi:hypothetical protein